MVEIYYCSISTVYFVSMVIILVNNQKMLSIKLQLDYN